jgi:hypothetical protein
MIDSLLDEITKLKKPALESINWYEFHQSKLIDNVNRLLLINPNLFSLIGAESAIDKMLLNHKNHAAFMTTVFRFGNYQMLANTIPWVYRTYKNHGFSYDYFSIELEAWIETLEKNQIGLLLADIIDVYKWMLSNHSRFITISQREINNPEHKYDNVEEQDELLKALLYGDYEESKKICQLKVGNTTDLIDIYTNLIGPVMHRVGDLWANNTITVAREHLASAIIVQTMSHLYNLLQFPQENKGTIVITTAPNEYHEIAALMIANSLESDGWNVHFSGKQHP